MGNRYSDDRFQRDRGGWGERDRFGGDAAWSGRTADDEGRREFGDREFGNREYSPRDYRSRDYGQRTYGDRDPSSRDYGGRGYGPTDRDQRDLDNREFGHRDYSQRDYGARDYRGRDAEHRGAGGDEFASRGYWHDAHPTMGGGARDWRDDERRWGRGYEGQTRDWGRSYGPEGGSREWGGAYGFPYGAGHGPSHAHGPTTYGAGAGGPGRAPWSSDRWRSGGSYEPWSAAGGPTTIFGRDDSGRSGPYDRNDAQREEGWRSEPRGMQEMFESVKQGVRRAFQGLKGYTRSDERIREDVCDRLNDISRRAGVDVSTVEVRVVDGEVTLTGTIDDRQHKHLMENTVEQVEGVKDVDNQIRVKRPQREGAMGTSATSGMGASATTGLGASTSTAGLSSTGSENGNRAKTQPAPTGQVTGRS